MIEINLLPGPKKKKKAAASGLALPDFGSIVARIKDPLLLGAVGAWVIVGGVAAWLYMGQTRTLKGLEGDLDRAESQSRRFGALISQKRRAEQLRDSLVAELNVIRSIDADRYIWPHLMEEVTKALPDYTWLVGVERLAAPAAPQGQDADSSITQTVRFQIDGRTSDIQAYTRFLRQLTNSPWVTHIVAGATQTVMEQSRPVTAFTLTAQFRRADSAYIRSAPLIESVR